MRFGDDFEKQLFAALGRFIQWLVVVGLGVGFVLGALAVGGLFVVFGG